MTQFVVNYTAFSNKQPSEICLQKYIMTKQRELAASIDVDDKNKNHFKIT